MNKSKFLPTKQEKAESQAAVHDAHEESEESVTETISVNIKRVGSASSAKASVEVEDEPKVQAEVPPLPSVPAPVERPPSSKSVRSTKSADVKRHPMEFLKERSGTEIGESPTVELESIPGTTAASATDTAVLSEIRSPSALSEGEDLNRAKSQMSWASSREVICHPRPSFAVGLELLPTVFCLLWIFY